MRTAALLLITASVLGGCEASQDVKKISAEAKPKLQRQLNGNYGVGRMTARSVDLIATDNRKDEGSATVLVDHTNLVLPLTVVADGKTTVLSSDDARVGQRIAQHAASIDRSPPAAITLAPPVVAPEPAVSDRDGDDDFCGRPAMRQQTRSLDGGFIYQRVCRWVTSDVVIQIRVSDGRRREVGPGNSLAVIRNGPWRGYLLLSRHKYHPGGGSNDPTFVVRPDGTEAMVVPGSEDGEAAVQAWLDRNGWLAS
ncbi:MAG: hypothetical protein V4618_10420 [Pseudomonadota bacterium]